MEEIGIDYSLAVAYKHDNVFGKIIGYILFYVFSFMKSFFGHYDIVYVHYPSYSAKMVLVAKKLRKMKLFVNVHGSDVIPITNKQKHQEKYTRKAIKYAEKVVVPSVYFKEVVSEKYCLDEKVIHVYPSGGINENVFYQYKKEKVLELRKRDVLDEQKFTVGFISRIYRTKGWDIFVEAVAKLKDYSDNIQYIIVGSGPDEPELNALISKYGLEKIIHRFPAQSQEKLADYYNILDIFVFATTAAESLGLVAIEAMACGIPVVASDFAAPRYYVTDGINGYKFKKGSSTELATRICYLHEHTNEVKKLSLGALKTAYEFKQNKVKETLRSILNE